MSVSIGLKKHGKNGEKLLLKEFMQFKDMKVIVALCLDALTKQQIQEALNMVSLTQEIQDHMP